VADYIPRWFTRPQTVTHSSTNRARLRVTTLIDTNATPPVIDCVTDFVLFRAVLCCFVLGWLLNDEDVQAVQDDSEA